MANAALGAGDGAQESRVVIVVDPQAKPCAQIFDFCAVKKTLPARDFVGNLRASQSFLKRLGHVVGAVQNCKLFELSELRAPAAHSSACTQRLNARHCTLSLVFFVVSVHHAHRFTFTQLRKQSFGEQFGVGCNHVVGRAQDGTGRAVILLELDQFQIWKVLRQTLQVVQGGAAPAVNRLVIISHCRKARTRPYQMFQNLVLRGIGVLVLVHQHMAHGRLPMFAFLWKLHQQLQGQTNQVVKIHTLISGQTLFVAAHDACNRAFVLVFGQGLGLR